MYPANTANAYKRQQVMTASPEELTLMLYDGAIRFITESMVAIEKRDVEKAHAANLRAQNIMREFMLTTDRNYEISKNWLAVDEYILHCLVQGNMKKKTEKLAEAKRLLLELREAWVSAMKQVRKKAAAAGK